MACFPLHALIRCHIFDDLVGWPSRAWVPIKSSDQSWAAQSNSIKATFCSKEPSSTQETTAKEQNSFIFQQFLPLKQRKRATDARKEKRNGGRKRSQHRSPRKVAGCLRLFTVCNCSCLTGTVAKMTSHRQLRCCRQFDSSQIPDLR